MAGGQPPKKRTSHTRTHTRRSHMARKLARAVNARSPVSVRIGKSKAKKEAAKK